MPPARLRLDSPVDRDSRPAIWEVGRPAAPARVKVVSPEWDARPRRGLTTRRATATCRPARRAHAVVVEIMGGSEAYAPLLVLDPLKQSWYRFVGRDAVATRAPGGPSPPEIAWRIS